MSGLSFYLKDIPSGCFKVVAGPTASGKSRLALAGALSENGLVCNADSQQLYQGLELLTAQPCTKDQCLAPHKLYGIIKEGICSSGQWVEHVKHIWQDHPYETTWIVGGSGLYLRALLEGFSPLPTITEDIKQTFRQKMAPYPLEDLKKQLSAVDPESAYKLHDTQRIVYALMIHHVTQKTLSWWHSQPRYLCPHPAYKILLWPSVPALLERSLERWYKMWDLGLEQEVRAFLAQTSSLSSPLRYAIGLKESQSFLAGECSFEDSTHRYIENVKHYIKQQRTWFRTQYKPNLIIARALDHPL